jgi:hypothetical protein
MIKAVAEDALSGAGGVYFNRPGVAVVSWDPTSEAVHLEWQGWANPTEYAAANDAVLRALKEHHASRALGDCRNMKAIQQSDQEWMDRNWFPRALAAGLKRAALVIAKSGLAQMNLEDILRRVPGTKLDVAYFATVEEAREWLTRPPTITPNSLEAHSVS